MPRARCLGGFHPFIPLSPPAGGGPGTAMAPELGAKKAITDLSGREIAIVAPLVVLVLFLGFYPKPVLDTVTPTVQQTLSAVQGGK